jgi:RNA polymerase sigma-70 factor (ECF subfamily)
LLADQAKMTQVAELVTRAKGGDSLAFDRLVELHAPAVYNLAVRVTHSREEAEDCVQEAFVRAFAGLRNFRGEAAFSTWLYRVALNVAREAAKKRARRPLPATDLMSEDSDDPPDLGRMDLPEGNDRDDPESAVVADEKRAVVLRALRSLPEHYREVVILYDLQGLSYEEIATVLSTRIGTVKSRLNRGRLALKEALTEHLELLRG